MSRVALVTGGTRGIGEALSVALKNRGVQVIASYGQNQEAAEAFTRYTGIPAIKFDAADYDQTHDTVEMLERDYGAIDILINNAGITRDKPLHKMPREHWQAVMDTNLSACYNTCHAVLGGMRERRFGRIINISSINGIAGQFGQTNYAATKAGMIGFTKSLAQETAALGITANVIAPGYVDTEMVRAVDPAILEKIVQRIPVGRLGTPEDIARAVLFLADDSASFITGSTLSVNGGQYMQ